MAIIFDETINKDDIINNFKKTIEENFLNKVFKKETNVSIDILNIVAKQITVCFAEKTSLREFDLSPKKHNNLIFISMKHGEDLVFGEVLLTVEEGADNISIKNVITSIKNI